MSSVITIGENDLTSNINQGVDILLESYKNEGMITEEQYEEMCRYRVVVHEHTFWGSLWSRIYKKNSKPNTWRFSVVRMCESYEDYSEIVNDLKK